MELARPLSVPWYLDPQVYQREREAIFQPSWIMVGYAHQVDDAGDYFTEDVAGWSIFVQRGRDGELRAFHNVCPHRAGPLFHPGDGCQANLVCRYHGWAFNADGSLLKARDFGCDVDKSTLGLTSVRVETWRHFVFVCMSPDTPPLMEWLGEFPHWCEPHLFDAYRFHGRYSHPMNANWKTYGDNFLENYHVPLVHPGLARDVNALAPTLIRTADKRWNVQMAPPKEGALTEGIYTYTWPNFSINVFPGGMCTERWLPRGIRSTELIMDYFFTADALDVDEIIKASEEIADEDVLIVESVQRNLEGGVYVPGVLSPKHEMGLADCHQMIRDILPEFAYP